MRVPDESTSPPSKTAAKKTTKPKPKAQPGAMPSFSTPTIPGYNDSAPARPQGTKVPKPAAEAPHWSAPFSGDKPGTSVGLWGNPDLQDYAQQNLVTLNVDGIHFTVNKMVATQFAGFMHDLVLAGYHPKSVGGYDNRDITDGEGKSNHAFGGAIDIDPGDNPRYGSSAGGKHTIDDKLARSLAAKWGLFWGGDYKSSKDYMHFEALGAPRTPGSPAGGTAPTITEAAKAAGATAPVSVPGASGVVPAAVAATATGGAPAKPLDLNNPADFTKAVGQFGFIAQLAKDVPDIAKTLRQAVAEGWDAATFKAAVQDTPWFQKHTDAQKAAQQLKSTNPAEYQRTLQRAQLAVQQSALQSGVHLTDAKAKELAYQSVVNAWSPEELGHYVSAELKVDTTHPEFQGNAGTTYDKLLATQKAYGLPPDPDYIRQQVLAIAQGKQTEDNVVQAFQQHAKNLYPGITKALDSGQTVAEFASPYVSMYSQELELPPGSVDMSDPLIQRALQHQPAQPAGGKPDASEPGVMPLWEFQRQVREDPRFLQTNKARDAGLSLAHQVLKDMGVRS